MTQLRVTRVTHVARRRRRRRRRRGFPRGRSRRQAVPTGTGRAARARRTHAAPERGVDEVRRAPARTAVHLVVVARVGLLDHGRRQRQGVREDGPAGRRRLVLEGGRELVEEGRRLVADGDQDDNDQRDGVVEATAPPPRRVAAR